MNSLNILQAIQSALVHHQAGRLPQAEAIYRQILQAVPDHPEALHYLGMIAYQTGKDELAAELISKAIHIKPSGLMYCNLGLALYAQGKFEAAVESYRKSLAFKPDDVEAHYNMGLALYAQGKFDAAVESFIKTLALDQNYAEAHNNMGLALHAQGNFDAAAKSYRKALLLKPDLHETYLNLGAAFHAQGKLDAALTSYRSAIALKPDYIDAYKQLGLALKEQGNLDAAIEIYRKVLSLNPGDADVYGSLGVALRDQGRLEEALENYRLSLKAKGNWKESLHRLTTPLLITTGLVMDSRKTANLADSGKQATALPKQASLPIKPATPSATLQESMHPEQEPRKNLRIILIYPPPWQIPLPGESFPNMPFGPPQDSSDHKLDGDFRTITYGLLTIAAQAKHAGYDVSVYNLSTSPWQEVVALIAENKADVYGISAFTANRRGMGAVAALVRQHHPQAHIMAGGPFVSALPLDTLKYYRDIDTTVIGEGEDTFMELLECLSHGRPTAGIHGTAWRDGEDIVLGPTRTRIRSLDTLASPFDYFTHGIVMTSRGCPSKCTFCGSFTTWGKMLRFHSAESCLDIFRKALARLTVPFIAVKDDTFTAHRRRTIAICDAIIESKMNFLWSCDTRVDSLDDELLRKMRLAGCQTISLGVESGSPEILKSIRKETTPEMVLEATRSAQKYGMEVRYYMIFCNRGETPETIQQSNELIKAGRPARYFFSSLTFFPGTEDWAILREKQGLTPDIFFNNDFRELTVATGRRKEEQDVLLHIKCDIGAIYGFDYTVEEREAIVGRLPYLHSAHLDLANAYFRVGRLDEAESALNRAEELGFPLENAIYNQRACIALARGEISNALALLEQACQSCPSYLVMKNLDNLRAWADAPVSNRKKPPVLNDSTKAGDYYLPKPRSARPTAM